jgi:sec-independent protein translocase protein TatC
MSQSARDEDLFADSTMSFGEHIEELRGALARALVGLAIGVGIAFFWADDAVRWIEKPLKDGLTQFNIKKATLNFNDQLSPEQLGLITDDRLAPTEITIEAELLLEQLRAAYPDQVPSIDIHKYEFSASDLEQSLPSVCAALLAKNKNGTYQALVQQRLSAAEQKQLRKLAAAGKTSPADAASVTAILNRILADHDLIAATSEAVLKRLYSVPEQRESMQALVTQAQEKPAAALTKRINRLLMAAAFAPDLPPPQPTILRLLTWKPVESSVQTLSVSEPFMIWFKAAIILGAIVASPWIFWQIWTFVAAGLYPQERNYVYTYLPFSLTLFFAGAAMAFFFVFPFVLKFLFSFNQRIGIDPNPRLSEWLNFALFLPLGFGISFQLPLVMLLLERIGVFTVEIYISKWRIAVLVIAVLSMMLTPADPTSMLLMGIPLTFLYFGGIGLCKWMPKRRSVLGEGYDP